MKMTFQMFVVVFCILFLNACEQQLASRSAVSVDTNAYYSVFQKTANDDWRVILRSNPNFLPKTITFTLDEEKAAYGLVFVCPSSKIDVPHEVHVYYSTRAEMGLVDFTCKKSLDELVKSSVYGSVKGVVIADTANLQGEVARIAVLDVTLDAWEAYAARVRAGERDFVAFKGGESADDVAQGSFLIRRGVNLTAEAKPSVIDLDFDGSRLSVFSKVFPEEARSTVNISGEGAIAGIQSDLAFFSENNTRIKLVSSTKNTFTFLPVPLSEFVGEGSDTPSASEFNPGEGHGILVTAKASDGTELSRTSKFFTVSDGVTHNLNLPKPISNTPELSSKLINDLQSVILKWKLYQDDVSGDASFYQWVLEGTAASFLSDKVPSTEVDRVKWHVTVTAGWLDVVGATEGNYTLVLPTHFEIGSYIGPIKKANSWRKEWGFKPGSLISWDMSAIVINENGTVTSVIDYLENRNFKEHLQFSEVYVRSKR